MLIGVLSDTHGELHPRLAPLFRAARVELILHAGDVGTRRILDLLEEIAPVQAVRGNVDTAAGVSSLPLKVSIERESVRVFMTHIGDKPAIWLKQLPSPPPQVAICGHSHIPLLEQLGTTLFLNPGSAGTRPRFGGPLSAALLHLENGSSRAEIITF